MLFGSPDSTAGPTPCSTRGCPSSGLSCGLVSILTQKMRKYRFRLALPLAVRIPRLSKLLIKTYQHSCESNLLHALQHQRSYHRRYHVKDIAAYAKVDQLPRGNEKTKVSSGINLYWINTRNVQRRAPCTLQLPDHADRVNIRDVNSKDPDLFRFRISSFR